MSHLSSNEIESDARVTKQFKICIHVCTKDEQILLTNTGSNLHDKVMIYRQLLKFTTSFSFYLNGREKNIKRLKNWVSKL